MANRQLDSVLGFLRRTAYDCAAQDWSDTRLLDAYLIRRDEAAFAVLVRRYGRLVHSVCRRVLRHEQDADDAFQATFLVFAKKAASIRKGTALACWLHGVAYRTSMNAKRARLRRSQEMAECTDGDRNQPFRTAALHELQAIVDEELQRLPDKYRAPFLLCCLEGLSRAEAARKLGWKQGTVSSRVALAREKLQRRLSRRGIALTAALCGAELSRDTATAAITPTLLRSTIQAALSVGAGKAINEAVASIQVAALAKGVLHGMSSAKLLIATAVVMVAGLVTGAGVLARHWLTAAPVNAKQAGHNAAPDAAAAAGQAPHEPKPEEQKPARLDRFGDCLPEGAAKRLGTLQRRAVDAKLAVSADGKSLIGVQAAKFVKVWDAATGKLTHTRELPSRSRGVWVLSPDGHLLVTYERELDVWDVHRGKTVRQLAIKGAGNYYPVAFSPDSKSLAALGWIDNERTLCIWDLASGKETFRKHIRSNYWSEHLAFSPNGKRLLCTFSALRDRTICWDIASGQEIWRNSEFGPTSLVISTDGKIYSSMAEFPVLDLNTGRPIESEKKPPISPLGDTRLSVTPDGRSLLISTADGVIVWDTTEGKERLRLRGAGEEVVVAPDGKTVFSNNGSVQRWDLATGKSLYADNFDDGHVGEVTSLVFSADGKRLASAAADGSVRLWDVASSKPLYIWRAHAAQRPPIGSLALAKGGVDALDLSRDGHWVISSGNDENLKLWNALIGKEGRTIVWPARQQKEYGRRLLHVRLTPDGSSAVGLIEGTVLAEPGHQPHWVQLHKLARWDLKTGQMLREHLVEGAQAISSDFSPDGRTLASNGSLIDVDSGAEIVRLDGTPRSSPGLPVAFSRDGALVVGSAGNGEKWERTRQHLFVPDGVRVWETSTGKTAAHLKTKPWVSQVCFHPDTRFVATNERTGVQVWDLMTGKVVFSRRVSDLVPKSAADFFWTMGFSSGGGFASCMTISPDGHYLATGHPDGTILLWELTLPKTHAEPLSAKEFDALWSDLAAADAAKAWRAVWRLSECAREALPLLRPRLQPTAAVPNELVQPLLVDLDNESFARREKAEERLKALGARAEPALRKALTANPSAEQKRRIEKVLAALAMPRPPASEELRQLRLVSALERMGTSEAQAMLNVLAGGVAEARLTREAKAVLERLAK